MRPLTILLTGNPIASAERERGGWGALIRETTGAHWPGAWQELDCRTGAPFPDPAGVAAFVITGSSASVTERADWMLRTEAYLRKAVSGGTSVLGICFGHQLLSQALGGRVEKNPRGREIGTTEVQIVAPDPLLDDSERPFVANMTHVDSVIEPPDGAKLLASTRLDPHSALRFGERVWGVQFHPEIDGDVMRKYISERRELIDGEGLDATAILAAARDARPGASVLRRFAELVR
jgi:GMP synthase (glutamine-hydrolysing)